uniref:Uncharacterized protein n=1 Tax=viral metagenome TaxID=1070528 RepID=A0A6C0HB11_9ZZZZ
MNIKNILIIAGYLALFIICFFKLFHPNSECMSLLLLIIFHTFLTILIVMFKSSIEDTQSMIWNMMFIGNILSFISLLLVVITYSHLYSQYKLKNDDNVPLSHFYTEKMKIFKILYIISISIIVSILFLLNFSDNYIVNYVSVFLSTSLFGITGYNVYNGNIILKLLDKTVIQ